MFSFKEAVGDDNKISLILIQQEIPMLKQFLLATVWKKLVTH